MKTLVTCSSKPIVVPWEAVRMLDFLVKIYTVTGARRLHAIISLKRVTPMKMLKPERRVLMLC